MKQSAGILLYRLNENRLEVLLVHPGGPFWEKKDEHAWSIPKGEFTDNEDSLTAAKREFQEETGFAADGSFFELNPVKQSGGKTVYAWAVEGYIDAAAVKSNSFSLEWPPKSGKYRDFPEIDKAGWFTTEEARVKIIKGQMAFIEQLLDIKDNRPT
jgi:predicted NUDIX family NTP pyrophosphohydrolase